MRIREPFYKSKAANVKRIYQRHGKVSNVLFRREGLIVHINLTIDDVF